MIGYVSKDDSYLAASTDDINSIEANNGTKLYLYDVKKTKIRVGNKWYDYELSTSGGGAGVIEDKSITTEMFADDAKAPLAGTADNVKSVSSDAISDVSVIGKSVITAKDAATARSAIGAGTSNIKIGTSANDAKAGNYSPTVNDVSDASDIGKLLIKATDESDARSIIGAGTSSFSGSYNDLSNKPDIPSPYTLPSATTSTIGGVKMAEGVSEITESEAEELEALKNDLNSLIVAFNTLTENLEGSGILK